MPSASGAILHQHSSLQTHQRHFAFLHATHTHTHTPPFQACVNHLRGRVCGRLVRVSTLARQPHLYLAVCCWNGSSMAKGETQRRVFVLGSAGLGAAEERQEVKLFSVEALASRFISLVTKNACLDLCSFSLKGFFYVLFSKSRCLLKKK